MDKIWQSGARIWYFWYDRRIGEQKTVKSGDRTVRSNHFWVINLTLWYGKGKNIAGKTDFFRYIQDQNAIYYPAYNMDMAPIIGSSSGYSLMILFFALRCYVSLFELLMLKHISNGILGISIQGGCIGCNMFHCWFILDVYLGKKNVHERAALKARYWHSPDNTLVIIWWFIPQGDASQLQRELSR